MRPNLLDGSGKFLLYTCLGLGFIAGSGRAGDDLCGLRTLVEVQNKQIENLEQRLTAGQADLLEQDQDQLSDEAVRKIVADYLAENPGAGTLPSVQTGFVDYPCYIRSEPSKCIPYQDKGAIPFTMTIRGLFQVNYGYFIPRR